MCTGKHSSSPLLTWKHVVKIRRKGENAHGGTPYSGVPEGELVHHLRVAESKVSAKSHGRVVGGCTGRMLIGGGVQVWI